MKTRKIAILGGSFDPITLGHIDIAQYVLKNLDIEEVWLSPCSAHLQKNVIASGPDRLEMCNLAISNSSNIYVCIYEIDKRLDGSAYTFLTSIKKLWDNRIDFHYIIGMDNVHSFNTWKKAEELKSMVKFIVVPRVGTEICSDIWYQKDPHKFLNVDDGIINTSSTEVRGLLKKWWTNMEPVKNQLSELIDKKVLNYISSHSLYKD